MRQYKVFYDCLDEKGNIIKSGAIRTKKETDFAALAGTENYLKSKTPGMVKMHCRDLCIETMLGDISVWGKKRVQNDPLKDLFGL